MPKGGSVKSGKGVGYVGHFGNPGPRRNGRSRNEAEATCAAGNRGGKKTLPKRPSR